jgi:hypothetical protein
MHILARADGRRSRVSGIDEGQHRDEQEHEQKTAEHQPANEHLPGPFLGLDKPVDGVRLKIIVVIAYEFLHDAPKSRAPSFIALHRHNPPLLGGCHAALAVSETSIDRSGNKRAFPVVPARRAPATLCAGGDDVMPAATTIWGPRPDRSAEIAGARKTHFVLFAKRPLLRMRVGLYHKLASGPDLNDRGDSPEMNQPRQGEDR